MSAAVATLLASSLLFLEPVVQGATDARSFDPTPRDPRLFGSWCQIADVRPCREVKRKIFGIPLGTQTVCVTVSKARARLEYVEAGGRGNTHGRGEVRVDDSDAVFATAGRVTRHGQLRLGVEIPGLGPAFGAAALSGDGMEMTVYAYDEVLKLRKDACGNRPPTAAVSSLAGETLTWGERSCFRGQVLHDEDESFPRSRMELRSDRDGPLPGFAIPAAALGEATPTVRELTRCTSGLSPGPHTIAFEATDSGGLSATAEVRVEVSNRPPRVPVIVRPRRDDTIVAGGLLVLEAKAFDPEEDVLDGRSVQWAASRDGGPFRPLGSGRRLVAALAEPGTVDVRVTARDGAGLASTATERVGVRPHEGNTPPRVTIEAPRHLDVPGRFAGTFEAGGVTFRGAVDDAEDGAEPLQLRWDAEPILPAGPALAPVEGSTLATFPLASIGGNRTIYRVTFRATDRGGLEGKQVIDVVVIP